jgi:hypothetical protein
LYSSSADTLTNSKYSTSFTKENIKNYLLNGIPLYWEFAVTNYYSAIKNTPKTTAWNGLDIINNNDCSIMSTKQKHAVVITGYDTTSNVFLFAESLGTTFGSSGYCGIDANYLLQTTSVQGTRPPNTPITIPPITQYLAAFPINFMV